MFVINRRCYKMQIKKLFCFVLFFPVYKKNRKKYTDSNYKYLLQNIVCSKNIEGKNIHKYMYKKQIVLFLWNRYKRKMKQNVNGRVLHEMR